jgi:PPOX class probable F420-dependent enzyme
MPSRRSQITMSDDEIAAFLAAPRTVNIATNGKNGFPHVVAMWYCVVDAKIAFWTFEKAQKTFNLRRDPKITCLVEDGKTYAQLRGVMIEGTAEFIEDMDRKREIAYALADRYQGGRPAAGSMSDAFEKQVAKRIGVLVHPERVISWDHTKLGGVY